MKIIIVVIMILLNTVSFSWSQQTLEKIKNKINIITSEADIKKNLTVSRVYEVNTGEYFTFLNNKVKNKNILLIFNKDGDLISKETILYNEKKWKKLIKKQNLAITSHFKI